MKLNAIAFGVMALYGRIASHPRMSPRIFLDAGGRLRSIEKLHAKLN